MGPNLLSVENILNKGRARNLGFPCLTNKPGVVPQRQRSERGCAIKGSPATRQR